MLVLSYRILYTSQVHFARCFGCLLEEEYRENYQ